MDNKMEIENSSSEAGRNTRNFRNNSEISDFYRFVYESDLRREAHLIFQAVNKGISASKKKAKRKSKLKH